MRLTLIHDGDDQKTRSVMPPRWLRASAPRNTQFVGAFLIFTKGRHKRSLVISHTMGWLRKCWLSKRGTPLEDWEVISAQKADEAVTPPEDAAADKSDEDDASPFAFLSLRVRPQFWVRAHNPAKTSSAHLLAHSPPLRDAHRRTGASARC